MTVMSFSFWPNFCFMLSTPLFSLKLSCLQSIPTNPAKRECGIRPIPSLSCPALELEMMGRSSRVMLRFPWVLRAPRPSRPLSALKKVCSWRARKKEGGNVRVLSVPLCYIMNEFGCNDLPLFKMSLAPLLIWLWQPQSCGGRVWKQNKTTPLKKHGTDASILGENCLKRENFSRACPINTSISSHLHAHSHTHAADAYPQWGVPERFPFFFFFLESGPNVPFSSALRRAAIWCESSLWEYECWLSMRSALWNSEELSE